MPVSGQPTPWWQLPNMGGALTNLQHAAPPGQYYDPTNFSYKNTVGSPTDLLAQRQREQNMQDIQFGEQNRQFEQNMQQSQGMFDINKRAAGQAFDINQQNMADRARRQQQLDDMLKHLSGSYSSGPGGTPVTPPTVGGPSAPGYTDLAASNAAQNAAFGQLKAKSGALGRSALQGLRGELSGRGILGSGAEGRGLTDILAGATNPLSDLNTAALKENVGIGIHNQDLAQQTNLEKYRGSITQRGQDIGVQQAAADRAARQQQSILDIILGSLKNLY